VAGWLIFKMKKKPKSTDLSAAETKHYMAAQDPPPPWQETQCFPKADARWAAAELPSYDPKADSRWNAPVELPDDRRARELP
jgi:hypothetical protein